MKKKLLIISLLVICGGITTGTISASLKREQNNVTEVKANMAPPIAEGYYNTYMEDLENKYAVSYKINYAAIVEALNPYLESLLEISALVTYPMDSLNQLVAEIDALLATFKTDEEETENFKAEIEAFISNYGLNENTETTYLILTEKYNLYCELLGKDNLSEINVLFDYIEIGHTFISTVQGYLETYKDIIDNNKIDSVNKICEEVCLKLSAFDDDIGKTCEDAMASVLEILGPVDEISEILKQLDAYYESSYVEKYDAYDSYGPRRDIYYMQAREGILNAKEGIDADSILREFCCNVDELNYQGEVAGIISQNLQSLYEFKDYESYRKLCVDIQNLVSLNSVAAYFLGSDLYKLQRAQELCGVFEKYIQKLNSEYSLPEEIYQFLLNAIMAQQAYASKNVKEFMSDSNNTLVEELEDIFNRILEKEYLSNYLEQYIATHMNTYYGKTYKEYYEFLETIRTNLETNISKDWNLKDAAISTLSACEQVDQLNVDFKEVDQILSIQQEFLRTFEYNENYKKHLDEFWQRYEALSDEMKAVIDNHNQAAFRAKEIYDLLDRFEQQIKECEDIMTEKQKEEYQKFVNSAINDFIDSFETDFYVDKLNRINFNFSNFLTSIDHLYNNKKGSIEYYEGLVNDSEVLKNNEVVQDQFDNWVDLINKVESIDELNAVRSEIDSVINKIFLDNSKITAINELKTYYDSLDKTEWTDSNITSQEKLLNSYIEKINNASSETKIASILKEAKNKLGKVTKVENHTIKSGCGSSVIAASSLVTILSALGTTLVLRKKKEEK